MVRLNITTNLDIEGPGADLLTVDANDQSAVFTTRSGVIATLAGLTIADGEALAGGGIENKGTLTVEGCTIEHNRAESGAGGGIANKGTLTLVDSAVAYNEAGSGGGIFNSRGARAIVTDSTLANNFALVAGGGLENQGNLTAVNSTVSNNAAKSGGGIFRQGTRATVTLADTIVAGNRVTGPRGSGPDMSGKVKSLGFNLIGQPSGSSGWAHNDLLRVKPLLAPLANNGGPTPTMALEPGSPASGAGQRTNIRRERARQSTSAGHSAPGSTPALLISAPTRIARRTLSRAPPIRMIPAPSAPR